METHPQTGYDIIKDIPLIETHNDDSKKLFNFLEMPGP
jgi:hypothetical protein